MKKIISTLSFLFLFAVSQYAQDNHCLDFDGTDDYVTVPDFSLDGSAFTVSFWFKCNGTSMVNFEERMLSFGPDTRFEIGIDSGTNRLWVFDQTASSDQSYGEDLRDGEWHHVAVVADFSLRTVYLDGEFMGNIVGLSSAEYGGFCRVGAWTGGVSTGTFFNGQIDEAKIWSVAKTQSEIEDNMNCPISGDEDDLLAYWTFDQGVAGGANAGETTLTDFSNNGVEGTLANFNLLGGSSNWLESDNGSLFYLEADITQDGNNLTAVADGLNYQWLDCNDNLNSINNETNQTFTASVSGSYAVEVSNEFCTAVSDCQDVIFVSVKNAQEAFECSIYPNPAAEVLFIETDLLTEVNITVSDVYGKTIIAKTADNQVTKIDLSGFAAGAYFVQIKEGDRTVVRKFVKE